MNEQEKKDRKKGWMVTLTAHAILLLLFIFFGLRYYEPKPEEGIAINFGDVSNAAGSNFQPAPSKPTPPVENLSTPENTMPDIPAEETPVMTQNSIDAPAIENKPTETTSPAEETQPERTKPEEQESEKPVEEPQPSSQLQNLLDNLDKKPASSEGIGEGEGDQGAPDGDPQSQNYNGQGGGGKGDGNYMLGNRAALEKPKPDYPCEDEGRVVVGITVNKQGQVVTATPGIRVPNGPASTTTSSCLYEKARRAAMKTTWQADQDAPRLQSGYIIYSFSKN